jgi:hypothetical protein
LDIKSALRFIRTTTRLRLGFQSLRPLTPSGYCGAPDARRHPATFLRTAWTKQKKNAVEPHTKSRAVTRTRLRSLGFAWIRLRRGAGRESYNHSSLLVGRW